MEFRFHSVDLERMAYEAGFDGGYPPEVAKGYRRRFQAIHAAHDERDLRNVRGNRFKRLKANRSHQHSMRLNKQWRLIVEIEDGSPENVIVIVGIEDYH